VAEPARYLDTLFLIGAISTQFGASGHVSPPAR
jgi:arginine exporter protein ArgO